MMKKILVGLSLLVSCLLVYGKGEVKEKAPNIVIFLVDDLGWNDTSLPLSGDTTLYNKRYRTPNLEKLASQAVTFTNAHSQALCVPSRASLLTGQNFMRHNVTGDYKPTKNKKETLEIPAGKIMNPQFTLPAMLKKVGYRTIHTGKYHLCEYESLYPSPQEAGFDVNIAGSKYGAPGSYLAANNFARKNSKKQVPGLKKYHGTDRHLTEVLTTEALNQLEQAVNENQPFFLYLSHYAVHTPTEKHEPYIANYHLNDGEKIAEAEYSSMIEGVDASLGRVMNKLKELNIADNTIVVFYSDNGGRVLGRGSKSLYESYQFNYPLRSGKASIYEGGLKVPGIIRWPGKTNSSTLCDAPVIIEDIYTTLLSAVKVDLPKDYKVDGKDLTGVITRKQSGLNFDNRALTFFLPYRFDGRDFNGSDFAEGGVTPSSAIIKSGWKLIYFHEEERFELYNLKKDIGEQLNLIEAEQELAKKLVVELDSIMKTNDVIHPIRLPMRKFVNWPLAAWNLK